MKDEDEDEDLRKYQRKGGVNEQRKWSRSAE